MARRAIASALAAIALWGTLATLVLRLKHMPPFLLLGCGMVLGGLCGARHLTLRGLRPGALLLGIYGLFVYHACLFAGLRLAPPLEANLLNYLWPLLIVLLSPVFISSATLGPRHVLGALLGFSGAALLVTGGHFGFDARNTPGYLLSITAAIIWATYSLLAKRRGGFPTASISLFCLVTGALSLGCHALFETRYVPAPTEIPPLLLIGLGPLGAAFYLWDRALTEGDSRVVGTLAYLTPLLSTVLVAASGEGTLTGVSVAAMVLIIGGAMIGSWTRRSKDQQMEGPTEVARVIDGTR